MENAVHSLTIILVIASYESVLLLVRINDYIVLHNINIFLFQITMAMTSFKYWCNKGVITTEDYYIVFSLKFGFFLFYSIEDSNVLHTNSYFTHECMVDKIVSN